MAVVRNSPAHSTNSTNVADLLERVLDKGVVIAGDIKVSLLDIELLTIQIRLVICSIDKAKEMGMDWWANSPVFGNPNAAEDDAQEKLAEMQQKLQMLEAKLQEQQPSQQLPGPIVQDIVSPATNPAVPSAPPAQDNTASQPTTPRYRPVDPEASA